MQLRRIVVVAAVAAVVAAAAGYWLRRDGGGFDAASAPTLERMADRIGTPVMTLVARGNVPGRTGEVLLVPKPHFYLGPETNLTTFDTAHPVLFTSHPNPWNYLSRVPIVLYGPGHVESGEGVLDRGIDLADVAPTYARLLGLDGFKAQGTPLRRGIDYSAPAPGLIFTIMIDGGGWNVLKQHPGSWPNVRAIAERGTVYKNATIGSSPAHTGPIHANLGTGSYPEVHGVAHNRYFENADPKFLKVPTVGDVWDERNGNRPIVGTISVLSNHLAMIGHGAQRDGGDRDIGVVWDDEKTTWTTDESYYELPDYLLPVDVARLETYERQMDLRDGFEDGEWFDNPLKEIREGLRRASTPAFVRYQGDEVIELIRTEPLGQDSDADLFYVQFKSTDQAGHAWNMINPEVGEVLAETDRQIGRIKRELDRRVGAGNYVLMISADHGQQPLAQSVGGWLINSKELERDLKGQFDADVRVRSHYVNIIERGSIDADELARFLATYTIGDNIPEGIPGAGRVGKARRHELVFAGAFPTSYLADLTGEDLERFGDGKWPESDLAGDPGR